MSSPEITEVIREIIAQKILSCEPSLIDDAILGNLDSLGRITLLVELENHFNVELTDVDYDLKIFSSISELADFVSLKRK
jgi:acyl carrier protein